MSGKPRKVRRHIPKPEEKLASAVAAEREALAQRVAATDDHVERLWREVSWLAAQLKEVVAVVNDPWWMAQRGEPESEWLEAWLEAVAEIADERLHPRDVERLHRTLGEILERRAPWMVSAMK